MIKQFSLLLLAGLAFLSCSKSNEANNPPKEGVPYTLQLSNGSAAAATFRFGSSVEPNRTAEVGVNGTKKEILYAKPGEYITVTTSVPSNIADMTFILVTDSKGASLPFLSPSGTSARSFLAFDPNDAVKDPNSYKTGRSKDAARLLANAKLKLKSWDITENGKTTDYYNSMFSCMKDDIFSVILDRPETNLDPERFVALLKVNFGSSICRESADQEIQPLFSIDNNNSGVLIPVYSYIDLSYSMQPFTLEQLNSSDKTISFTRTKSSGATDRVVFEVF
ncbi:hypothetical protein [Niabella hirudinis]|uniref:hypothetical protein n=1 Tax=Niabella hirudinis TaxID=1285929 RepID=UPI003EBBE657